MGNGRMAVGWYGRAARFFDFASLRMTCGAGDGRFGEPPLRWKGWGEMRAGMGPRIREDKRGVGV